MTGLEFPDAQSNAAAGLFTAAAPLAGPQRPSITAVASSADSQLIQLGSFIPKQVQVQGTVAGLVVEPTTTSPTVPFEHHESTGGLLVKTALLAGPQAGLTATVDGQYALAPPPEPRHVQLQEVEAVPLTTVDGVPTRQ